MSLDVLVEVVAAHEPLAAFDAHEPLLAGVRPEMSLEFVGASEPLPAVEPVADERPFPRVPTDVCPEVGGLAVHLRTVGVVTDMLFLPRRAVRVGGLLGVSPTGTVQAGAGYSTQASLLLRNGLKELCRWATHHVSRPGGDGQGVMVVEGAWVV